MQFMDSGDRVMTNLNERYVNRFMFFHCNVLRRIVFCIFIKSDPPIHQPKVTDLKTCQAVFPLIKLHLLESPSSLSLQ